MARFSGSNLFTCISFSLVCSLLAIQGCRHESSDSEQEIDLLCADWKNHKIIESVSINLGGELVCVDIVRNYREAKLGFIQFEAPINKDLAPENSDIELLPYKKGVFFVVLNKPYALRLPRCEAAR